MRYTTHTPSSGTQVVFTTVVNLTHKLTLTKQPVNPYDASTKGYIDNAITTNQNSISSHVNNTVIHPKASFKTLLDTITVSANEINQVSGMTYDVQGGLNDKLNISGDTTNNYILLNSDPTQPNQVATKQYIDNKTQGSLSLAPGIILEFPANYTPVGFLKCNGAIVSKSSYSALYAVVGDIYSNRGNGTNGYGMPHQILSNIVDGTIASGNYVGPSYDGDYPAVFAHRNYIYFVSGFTISYDSSIQDYVSSTNASLKVYDVNTQTYYILSPSIYAGAAAAVVVRNRVYIIGGLDSNKNILNTVYMAYLYNNGSISPFQNVGTIPAARSNMRAIYTNNRIYVFGGNYNTWVSPIGTSTVYTCPVNSDGSLGSWTSAPNFPAAIYDYQIGVVGNYVCINNYKAPINADGTLGSWVSNTRSIGIITTSKYTMTVNNYNGNLNVFSVDSSTGNIGSNVLSVPGSTGSSITTFFGTITPNSQAVFFGTYNSAGNGGVGNGVIYNLPGLVGPSDYYPYTSYDSEPAASDSFRLPDFTNYSLKRTDTDFYIKY